MKKSYGHTRKGLSYIVKIIDDLKKEYKVSTMCKVLGIARSTYYHFKTKKPSKRSLENANLKKEIKNIYQDSKGIYGAPKIHKILNKKFKVSLKRVQKYKPHSTKVKMEDRENILKRDFSTRGLNEKWTGYITYIHTVKDGWCYLASVMELYTRKIVGHSFGKHTTTDLVIKTLESVCISQKPNKGLIFHSDLGSQVRQEVA